MSDLPVALAWLGLAPAEIPRPAAHLSLASRRALSDGTLRFIDGELRVDASRLPARSRCSLGARTQIAGALTLDRLNLDAYWPEGEVRELVERTLALFGSLDAALEAPIERLTWHGVRLQDLVLDGRSVAGRLTAQPAVAADRPATPAPHRRARSRARELRSRRRAAQHAAGPAAARPRHRAAADAGAAVAGARPRATLRGDLETAALTLELRHDEARLALDGALGFWAGSRATIWRSTPAIPIIRSCSI